MKKVLFINKMQHILHINTFSMVCLGGSTTLHRAHIDLHIMFATFLSQFNSVKLYFYLIFDTNLDKTFAPLNNTVTKWQMPLKWCQLRYLYLTSYHCDVDSPFLLVNISELQMSFFPLHKEHSTCTNLCSTFRTLRFLLLLFEG